MDASSGRAPTKRKEWKTRDGETCAWLTPPPALSSRILRVLVDGILRGYKGGLLGASDYTNLGQCESLDDLKLHLEGTDYGAFLQDESTLHTSRIVDKCLSKLVDEWRYLRCNADEPLATFLDYCTYGHMIDNVVLIVSGTLHERDVHELVEKCHPLGLFDAIGTLAVAQNLRELYRLCLVDTPLGPYVSECLSSEDLDEMNVEILRNTLYKAYLEDFMRFCRGLGGETAERMADLLALDADRRALNITINSVGTELTRDDRRGLYPRLGHLHPDLHVELATCEDLEQVKGTLERCPAYHDVCRRLAYGESQALDKLLYEEEAKLCMRTFQGQFHYASFYAYLKLREQEIRNLMWISECVAQNQRNRIQDGIVPLWS